MSSPVMRSAEVEEAVDWLNWFKSNGKAFQATAANILTAYIAQLEASQPKPQSDEPHQDNSPEGAFAAGMESQANASKPYVEHLEAENKRLRGLLSAPVPTSGAVEVADRINDECFEIGEERSGARFDVEKTAAIIQQAMDGATAELRKQLWRADECHKDTLHEAALATQPPAAEGKLREALEKVRDDCEFVLAHGDDLGRLNTLTRIHRDVAAALAQPASGGETA